MIRGDSFSVLDGIYETSTIKEDQAKKRFYEYIYPSLGKVKSQEKEYHNIVNGSPVLKDHMCSLGLGLSFLLIIFDVSKNEDLKLRMGDMVYNVSVQLDSLSNKTQDGSLSLELERAYTYLREMMKSVFINPETREYDVMSLHGTSIYLISLQEILIGAFRGLLDYKANLISRLIKEKLLFWEVLVTYLINIDEHYHRGSRELPNILHVLFGKSVCLLYSCMVEKIDGENELAISHNLSKLLEKNKVHEIYVLALQCSKNWELENPLGSELFLLAGLNRILDSYTSFSVCLNASSMKLRDKLKFLRNFLSNLPHEVILERFDYLVSSTEAIISGAILIIYSSFDEDMKEKISSEVNGSLPQLLEQIEHIQFEVREMKLYHIYPKTDGLGFLDRFLEHLDELLICGREPVEILKNEIGELHEAFDLLQSFLRKREMQCFEHIKVKDLWARITELAYQAEYIIDVFLVKEASDSRIMFSITYVIDQTKLIMSEIKGIDYEEKYNTQDHDVVKSSNYLQSQGISTITDKVVVGFGDETEKIKGYLLGDSKRRDIISIVGMPGLGKTTLANKIYKDLSVIEHFDIRAWCTVSQTYDKKKLLISILSHICKDPNEFNKLAAEDLAIKLYKYLKGRRYLIVLDDIWDLKTWEDLVRSLPDDTNCSRVLITSRLHNVAPQVKVGSIKHDLLPLSNEESWELFQNELLGEKITRLDGKQIAESCKGLPLAIVVAAGLVAKIDENSNIWNYIAWNLNSTIYEKDSESRCKTLIELSYDHLPGHLKSCFLYFGVFSEGDEICVRELKRLWIAEGFVRKTESMNLEDLAEEYLMDLISRSLVTATKQRSRGGVKACRVHDLLRDFCLEKAKKDRFLQVVDGIFDIPIVFDQRRVKLQCAESELDRVNPYYFGIRTLFDRRYSGITFIPQNFMLLQVMKLSCSYMYSEDFSSLVLLIHLRYLEIKTDTTSIPPSISNLWNLQYLLLKVNDIWREKNTDVPDTLWDMVNLRHVDINYAASFNICGNRSEKSSSENLEMLSSPCFSSKSDAEKLLRRLPKLRKLKCIFLECWEWEECCRFPVMDFLSELMSVKVIFEGSLHNEKHCEFNFPSNLRKLTLSNCQLYWDDISKIGKALPNLKVLKLNRDRWDNDGKWTTKWEVNEEDFKSLNFLKLSNMNLSEWIASEESFPELEQLVVEKCMNLEAIPTCFGGISSMQNITVRDCKCSVDDSARLIQEEQEEWQNNIFKLDIYPHEDYYDYY